jgi:F-type H+-transporting ATPase subunit b
MVTLTAKSVLLAQEAEEPSPLLPHMSELIIGLVAFGILFYFLRKYVLPVFERTYAERSAAIEGGIQQAEQAQAEAQRTLEEYRAQLADAREEAARIRADAQRQGAEIVDQMRAEAEEQAERIVSRAQAQMASEREQVVRSLRTEVGELATDLAGRVVGESLADDARAQRVVERFLADLESANGATTTGAPSPNGGS